jgi:hypothetical protein
MLNNKSIAFNHTHASTTPPLTKTFINACRLHKDEPYTCISGIAREDWYVFHGLGVGANALSGTSWAHNLIKFWWGGELYLRLCG